MKVEIKTWNEMEEKFGVKEKGRIDIPLTFTNYMEEEMPADRIIDIVFDQEDDCYRWISKDEPSGGWQISVDMVKKIIEFDSEELIQKDFQDFFNLLPSK